MDDDSIADDMGIRVSGSNLGYSSEQSSAWIVTGIINKPIGDFFAGTFNNSVTSPDFAARGEVSVRVVVNSQVIPEPQEYALIFGLFALVFVFFHRHRQKNVANKPLQLRRTRLGVAAFLGVWRATKTPSYGFVVEAGMVICSF